jgi:hypothetical protein
MILELADAALHSPFRLLGSEAVGKIDDDGLVHAGRFSR